MGDFARSSIWSIGFSERTQFGSGSRSNIHNICVIFCNTRIQCKQQRRSQLSSFRILLWTRPFDWSDWSDWSTVCSLAKHFSYINWIHADVMAVVDCRRSYMFVYIVQQLKQTTCTTLHATYNSKPSTSPVRRACVWTGCFWVSDAQLAAERGDETRQRRCRCRGRGRTRTPPSRLNGVYVRRFVVVVVVGDHPTLPHTHTRIKKWHACFSSGFFFIP